MNRMSLIPLLFALAAAGVLPAAEAPYNAMGEKAGGVGVHSVILQTRLTAGPEREADGEVPGAQGWVVFEVSSIENFSDSWFTSWRRALPENDYFVKERVGGLAAGTRYFYRVHIGAELGRSDRIGPRRTFATAPEAACLKDVSFAVVTSHRYKNVEHPDGFESYAAMTRIRPDFMVLTGDDVYYDSDKPVAVDLATCRLHWHRMYSLPRLVNFFGQVPAYWEKDDHDYRFDDADPYMPAREGGSPDDQLGRRIFIWGVEQRRWLEKSISGSRALFKILVSPTPLLGPDRANKKDNHANRLGFFTEGRNFLKTLKNHGVDNFFILCGDRHWKYYSVHPETGYEEFCSGALTDGASVKIPDYSEPTVERKWYLGNGGFLLVRIEVEASGTPAAVFDFYEKDGSLVHSVRREAQAGR